MTVSDSLLIDAERVRAKACYAQARALGARARAMDLGTDNLQWRLETQTLVLRYRELARAAAESGVADGRCDEATWSLLGDAAKRARVRLAMARRHGIESRHLEKAVRRNASRARRQHLRLEAYFKGGNMFLGVID